MSQKDELSDKLSFPLNLSPINLVLDKDTSTSNWEIKILFI